MLPTNVVVVKKSFAKFLQKMWEGPCWEGVWPFLDPWDVFCLRTTSSVRIVPGSAGRTVSSFLYQEGALHSHEDRRPGVTAETGSLCIDWSAVDDGCPKGPDWESDVVSWTESEGASSSQQCGSECYWAKLNRRKDFSLPGGFGACESCLELPHSS